MSQRGRPSWKPTAAMRRKIEEMRSCGMSERDIALAMGVDAKTLRKHCGLELDTGGAKRRAEVIDVLFRTARKGNVSAIRRLEELTRAGKYMGGAVEDPDEGDEAAPPPKEEPQAQGKKAQRQQRAKKAAGDGGRFEVPLPPRLVVDNKA